LSISPPTSVQLIVRPATAQTRVLREGADVILEIPMPWLAGPRQEVIVRGHSVVKDGGLTLISYDGGVAGVAVAPAGQDPYAAARNLYAGLLARLKGQQLYRVWNYVPDINTEVNGLENYRAFNAGRHKAFIGAYGPEFSHRLPAASALGTAGGSLALSFLAGPAPARYVENPEQVPAFHYPAEYGSSPPSFARGTVVENAAGPAWFLSGTASIKGHATCGDDCTEQARLTFDNVRLMFQRMGVPAGVIGTWKVFLRHRQDLAAAQAALLEAFPEAAPSTMFLEGDICRRSLLLEVEAAFHSSPMATPTVQEDQPGILRA
jgi:chorismate lyase / 3-hydroxybenzoate synthase